MTNPVSFLGPLWVSAAFAASGPSSTSPLSLPFHSTSNSFLCQGKSRFLEKGRTSTRTSCPGIPVYCGISPFISKTSFFAFHSLTPPVSFPESAGQDIFCFSFEEDRPSFLSSHHIFFSDISPALVPAHSIPSLPNVILERLLS